jgi:serine/threonine protein kinase
VREIFEAICDLPASERAEHLNEATRGNPALRAEVESLLQFDEDTSDLLSESQLGARQLGLPNAHSFDEALPEKIGTFRILRRIGSGGMGDVYEAEQASPKRRVALKVMRRGPKSREFARRFEREGQIQATLVHPGIAAVYETGIDTSGGSPTPYFAMELVEGVPLVQFADEHKLDTTERLELLAEVCDAVGFAHQRGVIHRDLKPENILVHDDEAGAHKPRPKILDFGVAKLTETDVHNALTMQTQAGQLIGTLTYMSPEQLSGNITEVDTRADIYALGVLLYQLLSGQTCHETKNMALPEAVRKISEDDPTRISAIAPAFKGDIETIVHKAIERDKARRYASASELASDIRHYLANEPIAARPATVIYQMSKFARRHRALVTATGLVFVTLVVGIIATASMAIRAERARANAEQKTAVAEGVSQVLLNAFTTATPKGSLGKEPLLIDSINRIELQMENPDDPATPEVRAVVLNIVGIIYRERGDYDKAEKNFTTALEIRRRVLEPNDPNIADSLNNLGLVRKRQERYAEAAAYYQQAVDLQRKSSFPDDARLARNIYNLASAYIAAGEFAKAKPVLAESLTLHQRLPKNPELIGYHVSAQARIAKGEGRWEEASTLAQQALAMQKEAVGDKHPTIVAALSDLGEILIHLGEKEKGLELLRQSDAMANDVFHTRAAHPISRSVRATLIAALRESGYAEQADTLEREAAK